MCLQRPEEDLRSTETKVRDDWDIPGVGSGPSCGPLKEQYTLLTAESSPQPHHNIL